MASILASAVSGTTIRRGSGRGSGLMAARRPCGLCGGETLFANRDPDLPLCRCGVLFPGVRPGGIAATVSTMVRNRGQSVENLQRTFASRTYWAVWKETRSRGLADFAREDVVKQSSEGDP